MYNTVSDTSGGDGIVWGGDSHVSGLSQANGNAGDGWHIVSGGNVFDGPTAYAEQSLRHALRRAIRAAIGSANQTYLEPKIILPTANNAGGYAYYTQRVGTTAAERDPRSSARAWAAPRAMAA